MSVDGSTPTTVRHDRLASGEGHVHLLGALDDVEVREDVAASVSMTKPEPVAERLRLGPATARRGRTDPRRSRGPADVTRTTPGAVRAVDLGDGQAGLLGCERVGLGRRGLGLRRRLGRRVATASCSSRRPDGRSSSHRRRRRIADRRRRRRRRSRRPRRVALRGRAVERIRPGRFAAAVSFDLRAVARLHASRFTPCS